MASTKIPCVTLKHESSYVNIESYCTSETNVIMSIISRFEKETNMNPHCPVFCPLSLGVLSILGLLHKLILKDETSRQEAKTQEK